MKAGLWVTDTHTRFEVYYLFMVIVKSHQYRLHNRILQLAVTFHMLAQRACIQHGQLQFIRAISFPTI